MRIPLSQRDVIRRLFQKFIFENRSFEMTTKEFVTAYEGVKTQKGTSVSPVRGTNKENRVRSSRAEAGKSRSSLVTREGTPTLSPVLRQETHELSESQSPLETSYTEIHEKRKLLRKQLERRDLVTAVHLHHSKSPKPPSHRYPSIRTALPIHLESRYIHSRSRTGVFPS